MGGARCAYKSCTSRTDPSKNLHFFHYPVFDKVRCHKWITNSQKMEFLDLKISQLKNRVVCQHHFRDDNFMNYMKDKLKNNAIPTEDGPYCTKPSNAVENKELPINLDDIENDYVPKSEKKAHFSVIYGEFLTNDFCETVNLPTYNNSIKLQDQGIIFKRKGKYCPINKLIEKNSIAKKKSDKETISIEDLQKASISEPLLPVSKIEQMPDPKMMIEFEEINQPTAPSVIPNSIVKSNGADSIEPSLFQVYHHKNQKISTPIPSNKKVKIISEKKISEPLKLNKGEFQPVSPSLILKMSDKKKKQNDTVAGTDVNTFYLNITNPVEMASVPGFDTSNTTASQNTVTDQIYIDQYDARMPVDQFKVLDNLQVQNSELYSDNTRQLNNVTSESNQNNVDLKDSKLFMLDLQNIPIEYIPTSSENVPQDASVLPDLTFVQNSFTVADNLPQESASMLSAKSESLLKTPEEVKDVTDLSKNIQTKLNKVKNTSQLINKSATQNCLSPNRLKNKLPREKLAAIEEKRKFNMKIRDVIESCLNKFDDDANASKLSATAKKHINDKHVGKHLSEGTNLPSTQENQITFLEARLQRMEDTLLNKIEQNSQKINELKRTIKPATSKKAAYTQTCSNPETTKRNLYQQISQFLSPQANSLIYEELFINSCLQDKSNIGILVKRRKRK